MAEPTQLAEVVSLTALTPHTTELVLRTVESPLSFKPGQWISLQLPIGDHPPLNRAYSLAEPPTSTGHLTLVFDHVPGGKGSGYLSSLKSGDRLPLSGPYGHFVLPEPETQHLLLIGRYSGLVPLRCMIRALAGQQTLPSTTLIAHAPTASEQLYHDEFTALAATHSNFQYLPFVSEAAEGHAGTVETIKHLAGNGTRVTPMIAGIKAFARPLRSLFMDLGFDRREVKLETYD
ncbi:MAG: FAD-dependent oxidoreductase [Nitrospira sp.]|nr:FAD-dependent oxidoreductase [Nitrospira sp.]